MAQLNPYLSFNDNCREAMNFYQQCLGGELIFQVVGESPVADQMPPQFKDAILHSSLVSGPVVIFGSDLHRNKLVEGNTVQLCINCDSEDQINSYFNALAVGGEITEPLQEMFWGALYGALTDKFGKQWLFNYERSKTM